MMMMMMMMSEIVNRRREGHPGSADSRYSSVTESLPSCCLVPSHQLSFVGVHYLVCSLPIHKICALCDIFIAISVPSTTENFDDLEVGVSDGSRSLKATPVNSSRVISY